MKKAAAKRKTTGVEDAERYFEVLNARSQFFDAALNMGWQLALTIILPVFIGVKLDERFDSAPSYTLTALFFAITCAAVVVWQTIKRVNEAQANAVRGEKKP